MRLNCNYNTKIRKENR